MGSTLNSTRFAERLAPDIEPLLELNVEDYDGGYGPSMKYARDGVRFDFTIGPVPDEMVAALDDVAEKRGRICLYCRGAPHFFDVMALERKEPGYVRLAGLIVGHLWVAPAAWTAANIDSELDAPVPH